MKSNDLATFTEHPWPDSQSAITGEMTVAQAARRARVSEQSVGTWKRQFIENGRAGLVAKNSRTPSREAQLEAEIEELKTALVGEAHVELRVCGRSRPSTAWPLPRPRGDPH